MKLKNTPWKAVLNPLWKDKLAGSCYYVEDANKAAFAINLDQETARAIAALPETLERLERLEEAAQAVLDDWNQAVGGIQVVRSMNNLKKALEE